MLYKGFLGKIRRPISFLIELLLPILLTLIILWIFSLIEIDTIYDKSYQDSVKTLKPLSTVAASMAQSNRVLAIAPDNNFTRSFANWLCEQNPGFDPKKAFPTKGDLFDYLKVPSMKNYIKFFDTSEAIYDYLTTTKNIGSDDGIPDIYMGIVFNKVGSENGDKWEYTIRPFLTDIPLMYSDEYMLNDFAKQASTGNINSYIRGTYLEYATLDDMVTTRAKFTYMPGVSSIAQSIDRFIINERQYSNFNDAYITTLFKNAWYLNSTYTSKMNTQLNELSDEERHTFRIEAEKMLQEMFYVPHTSHYLPFPTKEYRTSQFYSAMGMLFPLFFLLTFLYPCFWLLRGIVEEKEKGIRETLKTMGLNDLALVYSWLLIYLLEFFIISVGTTLIMLPIFTYSNLFLIILFYFLFGLALVSICYLITAFFSKAKSAGLFGIVIIILTYIPTILVSANIITSRGALQSISLISTVAFAQGIERIMDLEAETTGFTMGSINMMVDGYSVLDSMFFLLLDSIIYYLLGRYFDNVFPKEYGLSLPWNYLFTKSYWTGQIANKKKKTKKIGGVEIEMHSMSNGKADINDDVDSGLIHKENYEAVNNELNELEKEKKVMKVTDLVKVFSTPVGPKTAVNKLNVTMYEGQIFVLLGHNGAGKTTSLSILSGMMPPTDGEATIYGYDIYSQMSQIRTILALCPQFDILWDNLTVYEHMYISATLQGVSGPSLDKKIRDLLYDVGLSEKVDKQTKTLSGGQKRKLSVAMSLVGDAKVVFLDEPTSGMDPYSRRLIWNLLRNYRKDRIIILTTHFMDEADLLGDRIGIMADGKMFTCGSSNFLKHKFGVGYNLTIVKHEICDDSKIKKIVQEQIPEATLLTNVGMELTYQLPFNTSDKFVGLFQIFDDHLEELAISTYGISVTTMEEVFLNSARYVDEELAHEMEKKHQEAIADSTNPASKTDAANTDLMKARVKHLEGQIEHENRKDFMTLTSDIHENMFFKHFKANFIKRFSYAKRDLKMFIVEVLIPIFILLIAFSVSKFIFTMTNMDMKDMSTRYYNAKLKDSQYQYKSRMYYSTDTSKYSFAEDLDTESWVPIPVNLTENRNLDVCASLANYLWCNDPYNPPSTLKMNIISMSRTLLDNGYDKHRDTAYHAMIETNRRNYTEVYHLLNSTSRHATIIAQTRYDEAMLRYYHNNSEAEIHMNAHPLPLNTAQSETTEQAISIAISQDLVVAIAFVPAYIVLFVVKEKEVGMKHQQLISGLNIPAYWLSTFVFDYLTYLCVVVMALILLKLFNMNAFIEGKKFPATVVLFLLYGFAVAPFTYFMSFFFHSHTIGLIVVLFLNILCCIMEIASYVMLIIRDTCVQVKYVNYFLFYLFPGFSFGMGFMRLSMLEMIPALDAMCAYYTEGTFNVDMSEVNPFSMRGIGSSYIYLIGTGIVYFILTIILDYVTNDIKFLYSFSKHQDVNIQRSKDVDDDVQREEDRIMKTHAPDTLQLKQLRKVYNGEKVAVDKITFGLNKGECFGLLGINGAGKTTTMKMLVGEIAPTKGTAELCGYDMMQEPTKVRRLLGMCPQTHALLDLLTVREHLELFGRIKGVKDEDLEEVIQLRMEDMGIKEYENKKANSLSGGNKRKLNVAQAMIGNPPLVLMDEPSTGMDPVSRRALWDIISTVSTKKRECTVIITTHSMEEAEALCTKVGIMVGGRLRCLGTIQHLKNKYGHGYTLTARIYDPSYEDIEQLRAQYHFTKEEITLEEIRSLLVEMNREDWIEEINEMGSGWVLNSDIKKDGYTQSSLFFEWYILEERYRYFQAKLEQFFNDVEVTERHGGLVTVRIDTQGLQLSKIFSYLEDIKKKCNIEEYSIAQITLEQIFNYFASQQEEETREVQGVKKAKVIQTDE